MSKTMRSRGLVNPKMPVCVVCCSNSELAATARICESCLHEDSHMCELGRQLVAAWVANGTITDPLHTGWNDCACTTCTMRRYLNEPVAVTR